MNGCERHICRAENQQTNIGENWNKARIWSSDFQAGAGRARSGFARQGIGIPAQHRLAGVGSLGALVTPRWQDLKANGSLRETKPLLASAALWADKKHKGAEIYYEEVLAGAVRSLDPLVKVYEGWVVRRLAPDCHRIELSELGPQPMRSACCRAMGWETGNIHLGTPNALKAVLKDLKARKKDWLVKAEGKMVKATLKDWEIWRKGLFGT